MGWLDASYRQRKRWMPQSLSPSPILGKFLPKKQTWCKSRSSQGRQGENHNRRIHEQPQQQHPFLIHPASNAGLGPKDKSSATHRAPGHTGNCCNTPHSSGRCCYSQGVVDPLSSDCPRSSVSGASSRLAAVTLQQLAGCYYSYCSRLLPQTHTLLLNIFNERIWLSE